MKISKTIYAFCAGLTIVGFIFFNRAIYAAKTEQIQIPFTLTNPQKTCELTFDNGSTTLNYSLGTMIKGSLIQYPEFTINVDCSGSGLKTSLTAKNTTGVLQSGNDSVMMRVNELNSAHGPVLWLENNNDSQRVMLSGQDQDAFCIATAQRHQCQLRPVIKIPENSPEGGVDVTLIFNVIYPQ